MAQPDYQVWLLSGVAYEVSFSGSHQLQPGDHVRFVLSADQGCANALTPPEGTLNGGVLDGTASVTLQLPGGVDGTFSDSQPVVDHHTLRINATYQSEYFWF